MSGGNGARLAEGDAEEALVNRKRRDSAVGGLEAFVEKFAARLRSEAERLQHYHAAELGGALAQVADDLEAAYRRWALEELTVSDAARESGYSEERLRELVRSGRIPRANGGGTIRVRRRDLPRKPPAPDQGVGEDERSAKLLRAR